MIRKSFFLLTVAVTMLFASCENYDHAISDIENRLDKIEGTDLTTITEQIAAINGSIDNLQAVDTELKGYITSLQNTATDLQSQIDTTNDLLAAFETDLEGQITASEQKMMDELNVVKAALETQLATINSTITALQEKDAELEKKIADLQTYVDSELSATKDWANATFSTLEQYQKTQAAISAINALIQQSTGDIKALEENLKKKIEDDIAAAIDNVNADIAAKVTAITDAYTAAIAAAKDEITKAYTDAIATAITASETTMKEWVNSTLAEGYYTKAEIEGLITALQTKLTEEDEALGAEIDALRKDLETATAELTAAYELAIEDAINENYGKITAEIAAAVKIAKEALQKQIDAIDKAIEAIDNRVTALETNFANRIQSVVYIPKYNDGKATATYNDDTQKWEVEFDFFVTPKEVVANIKKEHLSMKATYTITRAVTLYDMPIVSLACDTEDGIITVKASCENLTDFTSGTTDATAFLMIDDGNSEVVSGNVQMTIDAPGKIYAASMPADELKSTITDKLEAGVLNFTITGNLTEEQQKAAGSAFRDWCNDSSLDSEYYLNNPDGIGTVSLTLPDVTEVYGNTFGYADEAFSKALKSVNLPNATVIGERAFESSSLETVIAPKVKEVKAYSFYNCEALSDVQMPNLEKIGMCAFMFTAISTLPWGNLTDIGVCAFDNCKSINGDITLSKITSIGDEAFQLCSNLTGVILPNATTVGNSAFAYCPKLTTLTFGKAITSWGGQALHNGNQPLYTGNITLTLAPDQKVLSGDNTNINSVWTVADGAATVEFGENKTFCGYTFKEIKK